MDLSVNNTITDLDLIRLSEHLCDAALNLRLTCKAIRSCYVSNSSSIQEFVDFRRSITSYAMDYNENILPIANIVIQNIQDFIENYTALSFEDFKDSIEDLVAASQDHYTKATATYTKLFHQKLLSSLKSEEKNVNIILKKLEKDKEWYDKCARELRESIDLALIPELSIENLTPFLRSRELAESIAIKEESKLAIAATIIIQNVLCTSIYNFVQALADISEFFNILQKELSQLVRNHNEIHKHYNKFRSKASIIISSCQHYMRYIPDCQTDLQVIPKSFDKNYVQQWFTEKKEKIDKLNKLCVN